jgi:hypothetical protein
LLIDTLHWLLMPPLIIELINIYSHYIITDAIIFTLISWYWLLAFIDYWYADA